MTPDDYAMIEGQRFPWIGLSTVEGEKSIIAELVVERDAALARAEAAEAAVSRMIDQCVQAGRDRDSEWGRAQAALAEVERLREGLREIAVWWHEDDEPVCEWPSQRARQLLGETD